MSRFLDPLLDDDAPPQRVVNTRSGEAVAARVTAAFDSSSRRQGLLGRDGLQEGDAMLIAPCQAVHTWFMRFPIDVAFVAKDGRVVGIRHGLRPWRMAAALRAFAVLELPSGTLARSRTEIGDVLAVVPA